MAPLHFAGERRVYQEGTQVVPNGNTSNLEYARGHDVKYRPSAEIQMVLATGDIGAAVPRPFDRYIEQRSKDIIADERARRAEWSPARSLTRVAEKVTHEYGGR